MNKEGATLALSIMVKVPERTSVASSSVLPALAGISAAFPEVVIYLRCSMQYPGDVTRFDNVWVIPQIACSEFTQLHWVDSLKGLIGTYDRYFWTQIVSGDNKAKQSERIFETKMGDRQDGQI